jgi:tellurite resistance protein TehA-like permease
MSAGASVTSSAGARPSAALLLALWGLFVVGLLGVAFGVWSWSNNTFVWRLHIGAALLSFFATVVVLARLRLDLNRRRRSGGLIERPWTSIRTTTAVALLAWSFGIAHLALVGLELSSGLGG